MRKIFIPIFSVFAIMSLTANQCIKSSGDTTPTNDNLYGLPNATQKGANIFACRVNDSNWVVNVQGRLLTNFHKSNNRDTLNFYADGAPNKLLISIGFTINNKIKQGDTYRLNDPTKATADIFSVSAPCGTTSGFGGAQSAYAVDGSITFTKFTGTYTVPSCCTYGTYDNNAIISGTFNFVVAIPGCDSIKVTNGRFDINYSQY